MARVDKFSLEDWQEMARMSGYDASRLSEMLNVSPRQLQRYTKHIFGRSTRAWLHEQRLLIAPDVLEERRCVNAVAFELGFKRPSHFSREFKLHFGQSPRAYLAWRDHQSLEVKSVISDLPRAALCSLWASEDRYGCPSVITMSVPDNFSHE